MDNSLWQPSITDWRISPQIHSTGRNDDCPCCEYSELEKSEYECPCCKLTADGGPSLLKSKAKEYGAEMADKLTHSYAHEMALEYSKKECPERGKIRTDHYMMMYRIQYNNAYKQISPLCYLRYMLQVHRLFDGDINKSCSSFRGSYKKYKEKGTAAFDGSDDDEHYSPYIPEMREIVEEYYKTNPITLE
jgi:hypothetical protein